jgi:signal transduction histidine kinase
LNSVGDVWTGLGMAITKRIVEAHGGEIFVGSAEVGTEIVIRVPRTTMRKHNRD